MWKSCIVIDILILMFELKCLNWNIETDILSLFSWMSIFNAKKIETHWNDNMDSSTYYRTCKPTMLNQSEQ